jgi:N-carbamoyl-L-amino-acid hydrolase
MTKTNLSLDADRLWADIMALAEITDPARPTRSPRVRP